VLTGVIYGAIVVAWAAYLVPLALRRHDEASRSRSIERFSSAMRILAHRGSTPAAMATAKLPAGERTVVTPKRNAKRVLPPESGPEPERVLVTPTRNRAAERAAAARRRRVLSILVMLSMVVGVAALVGLLPTVSVAVPVLLVLGFLVTARLSVRRASKPYWVEVPAPEQTPGVVVRRSPARVDATHPAGDDDEDDDNEPTISLTAAQRAVAAGRAADRRVASVSTRTADGGSLWDPLPVTVPTYVTAPPAPRTIRTISLGEPTPPAQREASRLEHPELAVEVPRAVNG
jgi:hypothetical protein